MAKTWEILLWVIVAAAIVIIIGITVALIIACRRRNRRKKNVKHKRFEWQKKKDETDFGKVQVYYNAETGEAKILDQTDGAETSSQHSKVEYNARKEEARILGVGDNKRGSREEETVIQEDVRGSNTDIPQGGRLNEYQVSSQKSYSEETFESKKNGGHIDEGKGDYVTLHGAPPQRQRLQPVEVAPRETMTSQNAVSSYTNLGYSDVNRNQGYSQTGQNIGYGHQTDQNFEYSHGQSGQNFGYGQTGQNVGYGQTGQNLVCSQSVQKPAYGQTAQNIGYSQTAQNNLISNVQFQQPVAVVKAFVNPGHSSKWGQARSLPRNYSKLNYKKSFTTSTTPRRRPALYTWSLRGNEHETAQPWAHLPLAYKETRPPVDRRRTTNHRSSVRSRSFRKRSLRRQNEMQRGSMNGIYIRDSRPRRSYQQKSSAYCGKPDRIHFAPQVEKSESYYKPSLPQEMCEGKNYGDFYEEHYKMVKKSEFPALSSSSARKPRDIEPDMSSIVSGSEFSDFLPVPPRPSESQSDESGEGYSRGSYKVYKSRLEKSSSSNAKRQLVSEQSSKQDRAKHTKSFQETLDSLKNGDSSSNGRRNGEHQYSAQHEVTTASSEDASPWVRNDSRFRKQHGVPLSGVAVLPPEPVFIRMEDSDQSEYDSRK